MILQIIKYFEMIYKLLIEYWAIYAFNIYKLCIDWFYYNLSMEI